MAKDSKQPIKDLFYKSSLPNAQLAQSLPMPRKHHSGVTMKSWLGAESTKSKKIL